MCEYRKPKASAARDTQPRVAEQTAAMNVLKWNKRVSLVYAFGMWTMVGTYGYYRYTGRLEDMAVKKEEEEEVQEVKDPNRLVYLTDYSKTVIIYKKDFVPYSTRIYNLITSFSSASGSGNK